MLELLLTASVRDTISMLAQQICPSLDALKTWGQNMGHESISTTLTSYGPVSSQWQAEIMRSFGRADTKPSDVISAIEAVLSKHRRGFGT